MTGGRTWFHYVATKIKSREVTLRFKLASLTTKMGACSSKEPPKPARDMARWRVDDGCEQEEAAGDGDERSMDRGQDEDAKEAKRVELELELELPALNAVASNAARLGERLCLTAWEDGSVRSVDWRSRQVVEVWKPHARSVNRLVVGDKRVYSCSRDTTVAVSTRTESLGDAWRVSKLEGHSLNVSTIAVNQQETSLCSGGRDTQTIMWDLATATAVARNTIPQNVITCSKWIPNEPLVVQGSEDLSLKVWDERTALRTPVQTYRGYVYFALAVDVSADSRYILTSSKGFNGIGGEIRIWDRRMDKQVLECTGHQQDATACCFMEIEKGVMPTPVSVSKDGSIKIWDIATSELLCERQEVSSGMFTGLCRVGDSTTLLASTFGGQIHAYSFSSDSNSIIALESEI